MNYQSELINKYFIIFTSIIFLGFNKLIPPPSVPIKYGGSLKITVIMFYGFQRIMGLTVLIINPNLLKHMYAIQKIATASAQIMPGRSIKIVWE